MPDVTLDWSAAEVKNAKLTVPLDGDVPKGWKHSFEATAALLGGGDWGEVRVRKSRVEVADVEPGSEEKLRHHLEAVIQQANADHEKDDSDDEAPDPDEAEPGAEQEDDGPDAEMTRRFRSL
ncbi:MAG TPA: hypothetical protein VMA96_17845 [Solirubrobacteraceae bacterium]|nr:hypothetical protein [Solirubrobacteraceae bacterium]